MIGEIPPGSVGVASCESAPTANRLAELHRALARLVRLLDVDRVISRWTMPGRSSPKWAQPVNLPEPTRHTRHKGLAGKWDLGG
jgi:hypothetical protein